MPRAKYTAMADYPALDVEGLKLERARTENIPIIKEMVNSAYSKYVERIGRPPAPMTADYNQLLTTHDVFTLQTANDGTMVGSIVLSIDKELNSIKINNVVVDPGAQGKGYGRVLMDYAEKAARAQGRGALMLFTNIKMFENLGLYKKLGFLETERKMEDGFERVYFRKDVL